MLSLSTFFILNLICIESVYISGVFRKIYKSDLIFPSYSMVPNSTFIKTNKFACLRICILNNFCNFVTFKNELCSLHTENAKNGFVNSSNDVLYERKIIIEYLNYSSLFLSIFNQLI